MIEFIRGKKVEFTASLFLLISLAHTPVKVFPHIFDKNAAPQFQVLMGIALAMGLYITFRANRFRVAPLVSRGLIALVLIEIFSAFTSGNIASAFTGDTGRYAGVISTLSLIVVGIYHSQFGVEEYKKLIRLYVATSFLVACIGILQYFSVIELPGDAGVTSTFGNQDFYAAFIGISFPLYLYLGIEASTKVRSALLMGAGISIYSLVLATPLQSYVDIAITLIGALIYMYRKRIPRREFKVNSRTFVGTLAIIIWAEFIFLVPFLGSWIPVLGNDTQVKIRANFWLAGIREFFSHPLFGVGPDQYGSYYEKYRTLGDVRAFEKILSNDAHSASVQTLATVGIFGTLAFIFLIALVVRSLIIQWDQKTTPRVILFTLGLFFFVYLTNSFISPMTFPSKYIFWGLAGWLIGRTYLNPTIDSVSLKIPMGVFVLVLTLFASGFAMAQYKYSHAFERFAHDQKAKGSYEFSPFIPCFMYFEGEFHILQNNSLEEISQLARKQVESNPRCVSAHIILAQVYKGTGDLPRLQTHIQELLDIAPTRVEVLRMALEYAQQVGDTNLFNQLEKKLAQIGYVYVPGKTS